MPKKNAQFPSASVAIIGPGRLGQALAIALSQSGYAIKALVARRTATAEKAAGLLHSGRAAVQVLSAKHLAKLEPTDLILITTPDDAIEETGHNLAGLATAKVRGRTVLHTSGALSSDVLSPLAEVGFNTGSLHPLVSVSEPLSGVRGLRGAFYCVEGDSGATAMARRIVRDLQGKSFSVAPEHKALYHAAALIAAGHLTALIDISIEMLVSCGLSRQSAQQVLMPLVGSAVNNMKASPPEKALTGTFARGDLATVRRHLDTLSGKEQAEALKVYKLLGLHSLQLAGKKGIDARVLKEIRRLLE